MYVCICRAVSDHQIRHAVEQGACTLSALKVQLGVGSVCGRCVPEARELIAQCRNPAAPLLRLEQLAELHAAA